MPSSIGGTPKASAISARRGVLGLEEIHVLRRQRHRLPVEPAFQQHRPAGVRRADIGLVELALEAAELLVGQQIVVAGKHQRAGGPRGVVEQRLVPARRGIMGVDRDRGGLDRRQAIMVVERMEEGQVQDRRHRCCELVEAHATRADAIVVRLRPAIGARHHLHAIGPQRIEFADGVAERDRLDIGVAGEQEMRNQHLEEHPAILARVRPRQQLRQRMRIALLCALEHQKLARRRILRNQPNAAMHDGIGEISFAGETGVIARGPPRAPAGFEGDESCGARGFRFRNQKRFQSIEHRELPSLVVPANACMWR
jgi:hypothetical protein